MNLSGISLCLPRLRPWGAAGFSRRMVLAGLGSAAIALTANRSLGATDAPAADTAPADARLQRLLDDLAAVLADAPALPATRHAPARAALADAAARLDAVDPARLSPALRLLFAAVRDGVATEAALLAAADGRADGSADRRAAYPFHLRLHAGPDAAPRAAHAWGLAEARALHTEADALLRAEGLRDGSVPARLRTFWRDPRHLYPDSADGRRAAVAAMNDRLARTRQRLGEAFRDLPPAGLAVSTLPPGEATDATVGRRIAPPADGSLPGGYVVDLRRIDRRPAWTLPSVVHHELVPGHLLQAPVAERARPHPLQRRYAPGFEEGWAIYAEQLAAELGWLGEDPRARLGFVHWRLFRIARLVADTGLHGLGWSQEQAIEAMRAIQGESVAFVSIEEDVRRIIARPGAAAGQMLTAAALSRLRDAARAALGPRFSLAGFHEAVLRAGPLSVPGLEAAVRAWGETQS